MIVDITKTTYAQCGTVHPIEYELVKKLDSKYKPTIVGKYLFLYREKTPDDPEFKDEYGSTTLVYATEIPDDLESSFAIQQEVWFTIKIPKQFLRKTAYKIFTLLL